MAHLREISLLGVGRHHGVAKDEGEAMTVQGWVQVVDGELFFPTDVFGNKLPAEFAHSKNLLVWEASRNGATVVRATLTVEAPKRSAGRNK